MMSRFLALDYALTVIEAGYKAIDPRRPRCCF